MTHGVVGIEGNGLFSLGNRLFVLSLCEVDSPKQGVHFGLCVIHGQRLLGKGNRLFEGPDARTGKSVSGIDEMSPGKHRLCPGKPRIKLYGSLKEFPRLGIVFFCVSLIETVAFGRQAPGLEIVRLLPQSGLFPVGELDLEGNNDLLCDLIHEGKEVFHVPVVTLRPEVMTRGCVHKLGRNPKAVFCLLNAPLKDVPHPQILAYLLDLDWLSLVGKGRTS